MVRVADVSRRNIANYFGMQLETVSRAFSSRGETWWTCHLRRGHTESLYSRYIAKDLDNKRRKPITAVTPKMARVPHAIFCSGTNYRPVYDRPVPTGDSTPERA